MRSGRRIANRRAPNMLREMQASLHPGVYIKLLHLAATTGQLPILTQDGNPTGTFDALDTQQRIEVAKYLVNKIVPDAPRIELTAEVDPLTLDQSDYAALPVAELLRIANAEPAPVASAAS
jgi:hypothetical protein